MRASRAAREAGTPRSGVAREAERSEAVRTKLRGAPIKTNEGPIFILSSENKNQKE